MEKFPMEGPADAADAPGTAASPQRTAHSCRWGWSTLFLAYPEWLSAWDTPWSCRHPAHTGPLETVDTCTTCPDWQPPEAYGDRRRPPVGRIDR